MIQVTILAGGAVIQQGTEQVSIRATHGAVQPRSPSQHTAWVTAGRERARRRTQPLRGRRWRSLARAGVSCLDWFGASKMGAFDSLALVWVVGCFRRTVPCTGNLKAACCSEPRSRPDPCKGHCTRLYLWLLGLLRMFADEEQFATQTRNILH